MQHYSAIAFMPPASLALFLTAYSASQSQDFLFWFLLGFRYLRLVVHVISYLFVYRPSPIPARPSYARSDCTVIVPTVDPLNEDFNECLHSILMNSPAAVIIVTVGKANERACKCVIKELQLCHPSTRLTVFTTEIASKRRQVCAAIPHIKTKITVLADDHVFWPSLNFLPTVMAPFEDPQVGSVGTNKKVRREPTGLSFRSFFNFLGCVYLERHNFELAATNAIDGGVFVVSGRTSIIRTSIIRDPAFTEGFTNETLFFGQFGPLNADDDNFITRWLVTNNWKIKFQHCVDATIETTLGTYPKFLYQCLRWLRTTWRSNSASLFTDRTVWVSQPWCVYAVYITSFFNFALFYDAALLYTLHYHTSFGDSESALWIMVACIFASKMVKLIAHFLRCPADIVFVPGYIVFAYYHSLLKLYALFTFYVTAWGGRNLAAVGDESETVSTKSAEDVSSEQFCEVEDEPVQHHIPGHVFFNNPVSSNAPSAILKHHSNPQLVRRTFIETPWGLVRRHSPARQPANVLQSQIATSSKTSKKKGKKSSSTSSSHTISDFATMSTSTGSSSGSSPSFYDGKIKPKGRPNRSSQKIREPSSPDLATLAATAEDGVLSSGRSSSQGTSVSGSVYIEPVPTTPVEQYPVTEIYRAPYVETVGSSWTSSSSPSSSSSSSSSSGSSSSSSFRGSSTSGGSSSSNFGSFSGTSISSNSSQSSGAGRQLQRELDDHVVASVRPTSAGQKTAPKARAKGRREGPSRTWSRGIDCGQLHEDKCMLDYRGRCQIGDVRDVQWNGR